MAVTRGGVRFRKVQSNGSRFGPGKVHVQFWDKEQKEWLFYCRPYASYFVSDTQDTVHVTCKRCERAGV